ncbi:MAG: UTP--glucose-1-phosphate uridylyltransferase [Planctomycetaceae bacterium]|jgi:UDP-N-acetylglucosamine/UDP-N-acetylgalactosamine diphosphorylase|nr:UTP--glucose-1-phosphate uridylyltransferase [Planctomycetaceae bacterium]
MKTFKEIQSLLQTYGQEHLLAFWDQLDDNSRKKLGEQILAIDFYQLQKYYANRNAPAAAALLADNAKDPPAYKFSTVPAGTPDCAARVAVSAADAVRTGEAALADGKVGVVLVAGGQGTRLGFEHPKGMFPIAPVSNNTLFQIHVEKVVATAKRYGKPVPLCVMTSPATHDETVAFFNANGNFGLPDDDLFVFCQGTMPAVDEATGRVLLAEKDSLALSPDGHGGMLAAINKSTLPTIAGRGIESLFYFQVDNPLVKICSPEYIGYQLLSGAEMTCQVIRKRFPDDRVGNVVDVDGRLHIIEYSDLPLDVAKRTRTDGSLAIWAGSIAVHIFAVAFLQRQAAQTLPIHIARKKVGYIDTTNGAKISPDKPNAIKFEKFVFDLLPSADNAVVVEVDVPNHYAPLKNAVTSETDNERTVRNDIVAQYTRWLQRVNVTVADGTAVEISPLFALDESELVGKVDSGRVIDSPIYFK